MPLQHEKLVAWQRADDLFLSVHVTTRTFFPSGERYELTSQIRKAVYSVPANIVEGVARRSLRARLYHLNVAEASLAELAYCLHAARRLGYLDAQTYAQLDREVRQTAAPLVGLIRADSRRKDRSATNPARPVV